MEKIDIFEVLLNQNSTIPLNKNNLESFIESIKNSPPMALEDCKEFIEDCLKDTDRNNDTLVKKLLKYKRISMAKKLLKDMAIEFDQKEIFEDAIEKKLIPFDSAAGELLREHHDHVLHSVYVFLLGCYFVEKVFPFYKIVNAKRDEFLRKWSIISMFHDSGYPTEIGAKIMHQSLNGILDIFNDLKQSKNHKPIVEFKFKQIYRFFLIPTKFREIYQEKDDTIIDILDLISKYMSEHVYNKTLSPIKIREIILQIFNDNLTKGYIDHGLLSAAIYFNYAVCDIINKHNSTKIEKKHYFNEVIISLSEILTAIYLHNAYIHFPEEFRIENFKLTDKTLLIYLIILIDELQIWGRDFSDEQNDIKNIEIINDNHTNSSNDEFKIWIKYIDNDLTAYKDNVERINKIKDKINKIFGDQIIIRHTLDDNIVKPFIDELINLITINITSTNGDGAQSEYLCKIESYIEHKRTLINYKSVYNDLDISNSDERLLLKELKNKLNLKLNHNGNNYKMIEDFLRENLKKQSDKLIKFKMLNVNDSLLDEVEKTVSLMDMWAIIKGDKQNSLSL